MKKLIKIIGIVLAISLSMSTAAYDDTSDEICSVLREAIKEAKNKFERLEEYSKKSGRNIKDKKMIKDGWLRSNIHKFSFAFSLEFEENLCSKKIGNSCKDVKKMKNILKVAKDKVSDVRDDYALNGCSTDSKSNTPVAMLVAGFFE